MYKENPKTKGSGILCAIPQTGTCPNKCEDCFFQSGRSYLEPLQNNLPNMPEDILGYHVVRVNDGNDSNNDKDTVFCGTAGYLHKFYNTAIPNLDFDAPVVLTANPGKMTDSDFHKIDCPPDNLMFVRFRANTWNTELQRQCIRYYCQKEIPIVLTFMAYFNAVNKIPKAYEDDYVFRKRTLNSYYAITTKAWHAVMKMYEDNKWVYSCGKIEGEKGDTHCRFCGNCLREYFAALVKMNKE
ncbi:MAG TPA: hypothetical protein VMV77_01270 [Bacteroidales bacterium]|nr:hypothetical protein [Bacteroidales bacterium]